MAHKMQYLGTLSHTDRTGRKCARDVSKEALGELIMRLLTVIFRAVLGSRRQRLNRLTKVAVYQEQHASGTLHYHFPVLVEYPWSHAPLKRALHYEGFDVDFSEEHDYY